MSWDRTISHQNENLKRRIAEAPKGPTQLSRDVQTLRELLPRLDVRFKVGAAASMLAFAGMVGLLLAR